MAGVLEALAQGLRGAGGTLSPEAFKAMNEEDAQSDQLKRQIQLYKFQQDLAGINEKLLSNAVGPFLEKGDLSGAAAAAAKSGAPGGTKLALDLADKAEARKSREQIQSDALAQRGLQILTMQEDRKARLDQAREFALQRAADQKERDAVNAQFKASDQRLREENQRLHERFMTQGYDLKKAELERKNDQDVSKNVQKLGGALEKAGLNESDAVLGAAEDALRKNPNLAEFISGKYAKVPDIAVGAVAQNADEIRAGRQAFNKLFNVTLKQRSGSAVTQQELERLTKEFGAGMFKTPQQLNNALEQARNVLGKHYAGVASSYGPKVMDAYNENRRAFGGRIILETPEAQGGTQNEGWTVQEIK